MMTAGDVAAKQKKLWEIVATIRTSIQQHARGRFKDDLRVERTNLASIMPGNVTALGHVLWMCDEIDGFIREQRFDKANRWIGFMQGVLWITGVASIDESREINQ
jgi:hypothetical protein